MYISSVLLVAFISARVNAVPLNINLGAYSPALVVGDGEISFKGKEEVSQLMDALEGAAVSGAAKNGASGDGTDADTGEGLGISQNPPNGGPLQGMGKTISPRITKLVKRDSKRRDINGFNAALSYASEALGKGPTVELSTGPSGSGVGVKVNPKSAGAAAKVAGSQASTIGAKPIPQNGLGRRDESNDTNSKTETTVTTMFVRGSPILEAAEEEKGTKVLRKRSISNAEKADSVNLNVADGQFAELTFVETRSMNNASENEE